MVDTAPDRSADVGAPSGPVPRGLPLRWAVPAAVGAGLALLVAFPPYDLWWCAPVAVALLAAATHRRGPLGGAGLGLVTGLVFFLPLLSWTNLHTGSMPWLLLSVLQAGYLALLGAAGAWVSRFVDRVWWVWPPVVGVLWVAQEALRSRAPFGGFPWGRLVFSQADAPTVRLAAVGGAPLVTFAVALAGGFLVAGGWQVARRRRAGRRGGTPSGPDRPAGPLTGSGWRPVLLALGAAVTVMVAGAAVPVPARPSGPAVTVAIVQGNVPRMGLDFNAQRRAVLDNHVNATVKLAERVDAGAQARPDLVVWPENSSDIDPLLNADAAGRISQAAAAIRAPILVGAVLRGEQPGQSRNAALVWWPDRGADPDQMYLKRHPVPFAEYVPLRDLVRRVTDKVDLVRTDMVAGTRPGVLRVGPAVVGGVICFEVAYDGLVRDTVVGGAQLLAVQTNNATFDVAEARQQLAMVRVRAVEHGRAALMASTVGVSGFVGPDGRVSGATGFNTDAVVVRQIRLGQDRTVATRLGWWPEAGLVGLAVLVLIGAGTLRSSRVRWRRVAG